MICIDVTVEFMLFKIRNIHLKEGNIYLIQQIFINLYICHYNILLMKMYKSIILLVILYWCEIWFLVLRKEHNILGCHIVMFWLMTLCSLAGGYQRSEEPSASIFKAPFNHLQDYGVITQKTIFWTLPP
jgi:hypothetical protein